VTEVFPGFPCFSKQVPYNNLNESSAVSYYVVFQHIIHCGVPFNALYLELLTALLNIVYTDTQFGTEEGM